MARTRAYRRQKEINKKRWVRDKLHKVFRSESNYPSDHRNIGLDATTPHPCSCYGCGNRRKYDGPSIDEVRSSIDFVQQLEEL